MILIVLMFLLLFYLVWISYRNEDYLKSCEQILKDIQKGVETKEQ